MFEWRKLELKNSRRKATIKKTRNTNGIEGATSLNDLP